MCYWQITEYTNETIPLFSSLSQTKYICVKLSKRVLSRMILHIKNEETINVKLKLISI